MIEVKNVSGRTRYIAKYPYPFWLDHDTLDVTGPTGQKVGPPRGLAGDASYGAPEMEPLGPGEVKRVQAPDLRNACTGLHPWRRWPQREPTDVATGTYVAQFRFRSPKLEPRMVAGSSFEGGILGSGGSANPMKARVITDASMRSLPVCGPRCETRLAYCCGCADASGCQVTVSPAPLGAG